MNHPNNKSFCITGAGLVGSLWSIFLAKKGFKVDVYERRDDMRKANIAAGRSINLALSDRGWKALKGAGVDDKIRNIAIPMYGRVIHDIDGKQKFLPYSSDNKAIYSVSRAELNKTLLAEADLHDNVNFYFNERIESVDLDKASILNANGQSKSYDAIFGADGAFSAVRQSMVKTDRFDYSQNYIEHAYKEMSIPAADNPENPWLIEKNALHIWPRKSFMMIALPNIDGSFTVTLFLAYNNGTSFSQLQNSEDVTAFFKTYFPDAIPLMPNLLQEFEENPVSSLVTIRCNPWNYKNKALLIGDAAHAIVPFFGQGMNAGFEDCTVLDKMIVNKQDPAEVFEDFSKTRKKDGDAIADLALDNFIEMRELVADPHFLLKKKIEAKIIELFPDKWTALYSMVTFSHIPYSEALRLGKKNDELLEKLAKIENEDGLLNKADLKEKLAAFLSEHNSI